MPGTAGDIAMAGAQLAVAVTGTGSLPFPQPLELRGDPASVLVVFDRTTGTPRWRLAFDSTEWALITSIAAAGDDFIVAGSFGGTLRVGSKVVSTGGASDGFVARVAANGQLAWLVRLGGPGADGIQGVATNADAKNLRIAIAGTFSVGADILGHPLASQDDRSPFGDAYVAELDGSGAWRWQSSFGSRADDAVAGVAIDGAGNTVVAASVRDVVKVGSATFVTSGAGDGIAVWFGSDGEIGATAVLGAGGFDGIRDIATIGDRVVVGGFFSGWIKLGDREYEANGGDDSFVAALDPNGTVQRAWHVAGAGREEITSLSSMPGGFVAGIAHTAAAVIDGENIAAPVDPSSGAAIVIRGY